MPKNTETIETPDASVADLTPGKVTAVETPDAALVPTEKATNALTTRNDLTTGFTVDTSSICKRVKIAYSVSTGMPDGVVEGDLVIGDSANGWTRLLPATSKTPLTVLVANIRQYYKEWLDANAFTSGIRPKVYPDAAAARADGQTTEWSADGKDRPTVSMAYDINLLVKQPEGYEGDDHFNIIIDGEAWAPCVLTVDKAGASVVRTFFSNLLTADASARKVPVTKASLSSYFCTLCVTAKPFRNNPARKARIPTFKCAMDSSYCRLKPTESFMEQVQGILSCIANPSVNNSLEADENDLPF